MSPTLNVWVFYYESFKNLIATEFKNSIGHYYTRTLFTDTPFLSKDSRIALGGKAKFSLFSRNPPTGIISCPETFVGLGDPTGYKWAMLYLNGDWGHWLQLLKSHWFRDALDGWLDELETKIRSEATDNIRLIMNGGGPQALNASRYLATLEYKKPSAGRPSKAELQGALKKSVKALEIESEDADRIGLKLVKNKD